MDVVACGSRQMPFILGRLVAELMAAYQSGIEKELHGCIGRGAADMVSLELHRLAQHIYIKVVGHGENFLEQRVSLGCTSHAVGFQIAVESIACALLKLGFFHLRLSVCRFTSRKVTLYLSKIKIFRVEVPIIPAFLQNNYFFVADVNCKIAGVDLFS